MWHFEDKLPQLHYQYPLSYVGFIRQKVKQSIKAHVPLAFFFVKRQRLDATTPEEGQ